jgi:heat shock protein HslJ
VCGAPAGIMEQEATFLELMQQANSFFISAGQLTVYDSTGNQILVFNSG